MTHSHTTVQKLTLTAIFVAAGAHSGAFFTRAAGLCTGLSRTAHDQCAFGVAGRHSQAMGAAFAISSLRLAMGAATVFSYPGSMIGAFLSAALYERTGLRVESGRPPEKWSAPASSAPCFAGRSRTGSWTLRSPPLPL